MKSGPFPADRISMTLGVYSHTIETRLIATTICLDFDCVDVVHYTKDKITLAYEPGTISHREILRYLSRLGVQGNLVLRQGQDQQQTTTTEHTADAAPENVEPPRFAKALALFLLSRKFSDGTIGDLDQLYRDEALELYSRRGADLWYWWEIINLIRRSAQEGLRKLMIRVLQLAGLGWLVAVFDKLRGLWS